MANPHTEPHTEKKLCIRQTHFFAHYDISRCAAGGDPRVYTIRTPSGLDVPPSVPLSAGRPHAEPHTDRTPRKIRTPRIMSHGAEHRGGMAICWQEHSDPLPDPQLETTSRIVKRNDDTL